ncbi:hypothetical protein Ddc_00504 [Ditylenchus destructor]|nr:hypothetical protein Ddc_00504 [Ditylenchus destructor]
MSDESSHGDCTVTTGLDWNQIEQLHKEVNLLSDAGVSALADLNKRIDKSKSEAVAELLESIYQESVELEQNAMKADRFLQQYANKLEYQVNELNNLLADLKQLAEKNN